MVPSRFLQRLKAFTGKEVWDAHDEGAASAIAASRATLDTPEPAPPLAAPAPEARSGAVPAHVSASPRSRPWCAIPTRSSRATSSSSTRSMPIAVTPGAADRGTIIHDVLGRFAEQIIRRRCRRMRWRTCSQRGADAFADIAEAYPELYAEWWPRFSGSRPSSCVLGRSAAAPHLVEVYAERSGALPIPLAGRHDLHPARPRRPDRAPPRRRLRHHRFQDRPAARRQGGLCRLLAAADARGDDADGGRVQGPARARRRRRSCSTCTPPAGASRIEAARDRDRRAKETRPVAEIVEEHRRRFEGMIARYAKGEAAYLSRPFPKYARRYLGIRPSGAREGMVAGERGRRRGLRMSTDLVIPRLHQGCAAPRRRTRAPRPGCRPMRAPARPRC